MAVPEAALEATMNASPGKPPFQFGLGSLLAAFAIVPLVIGLVPMAAALVVGNRVIDDGPQPGDQEIIDEWNSWAFSARFVLPALGGLGILVAAAAMHARSRTR
jgi:hypothetical protein